MKIGLLILAGSGEFTDAMLETDRYITGKIPSPNVAIIPTAAGKEHDWWKWADMGIRHYASLGVSAFGVAIRAKKDAETPSVLSGLEKANMFYFSGGDPGYVLSVLSGSPAWKIILRKFHQGAALAGSSAGAMMMGSWVLSNIYSVWDKGENAYKWDRALNLVPFTVWPHFDFAMRQFPEKIKSTMEHAPADAKTQWLGIDEDTAVIWEDGREPYVRGNGKAHWGNTD
jgi:cyanophycinase